MKKGSTKNSLKKSSSTRAEKNAAYPLWTINWAAEFSSSSTFKQPILIVGLPGIGNVGKIVSDIFIENLKAVKVAEFFSYELPNSVFVQESNLVSLPRLELYHTNVKGRDFLFLSGDVQPMTESASYQFAELVLDLLAQWKGKEIITLGGIGLSEIPEDPQLYITGTNAQDIDVFSKGLMLEKKLYGVVGPIIGLSGILIGLSGKRSLRGFCILAETFGHQMYLGLVGARKIIMLLSKKYGFPVQLGQLDKEISKFHIQLKDEQTLEQATKRKGSDINYIG